VGHGVSGGKKKGGEYVAHTVNIRKKAECKTLCPREDLRSLIFSEKEMKDEDENPGQETR